MDKIKYLIGLAVIIMMVICLASCGGAESMIIADGPTNVYSEYPANGMPKQDKVIAVLNKDDSCDVISTRYSKDFQFYTIRLKDGREGYVQFGDNFRVVPKSKG